MADKTWKAVERAYAELFGMDGRTGPQGEGWPDAIGNWLTLEVKHRSRFPIWLYGAVAQARANTDLRAPGRLPLVILHRKGQRYLDGLVVLTVGDFLQNFGGDSGDV